jgi:transcriptional regulator with XRE-family HTH domain
MRQLRTERGLSLRELALRTRFGKSTLSQLETGRTAPSADTAQRLDAALDAKGELARMVHLASQDGGDDGGRLRHVAANPRRIEVATVNALAELLAGQRRLEDSIGSGPPVSPVLAHVATVSSTAKSTSPPPANATAMSTAPVSWTTANQPSGSTRTDTGSPVTRSWSDR